MTNQQQIKISKPTLGESKVRTLFAGTSSFAIAILEALLKAEFIDIVGIITQPDKPFGRKMEIMPPPVKNEAQKRGLNCKIYQPEKLARESMEILEESRPELIVVAAYGQIVPDDMLSYPPFKTLNIHGSILPKYRGAVPVHMAILNGDTKTGISIQVMASKMDAGDIIASTEVVIESDDTAALLMDRLASIGGKLLVDVLPRWISKTIKQVPQSDIGVSYCYQKDVAREKAEINWTAMTSERIDRMVRAFQPWPSAWFKIDHKNTTNEKFHGKMMKIYDVSVNHSLNSTDWEKKNPGEFFKSNGKFCVRTMDSYIQINEGQIEGKSRMNSNELLFLV